MALLGTVLSAQSQTFTNIYLPGSWPSNTWWTNSPLPTSIVTSQAWQAVNENFKRASNALAVARTYISTNTSGGGGNSTNWTSWVNANRWAITNSGAIISGGNQDLMVDPYPTNSPGEIYGTALHIWSPTAHTPAFHITTNGASGNGAGITNIPPAGIVGLPDAQTNAMLNSFRAVAWTSNSISIAAGATNIMGWVTNLAGVDYTASLGNPQLLLSYNGTNWASGSATLITNTRVKVAFYSGTGLTSGGDSVPDVTPIPMPGGLSSVIAYKLVRPDLFGRTNALLAQGLQVSDPVYPTDAASKRYVDGIFVNTAWWSAQRDVELNSYSLHQTATWELQSSTNATYEAISETWLGDPIWRLNSPLSSPILITNIQTYNWASNTVATGNNTVGVENGTNVLITVASGITNTPVLLYSHTLAPPHWTRLACVSSYPATNVFIRTQTNWDGGYPPAIVDYTYVTNRGILMSFTMPYTDQGFIRAAAAASVPSFAELNGVLALTQRTVTNATSTTWAHGAGLVCVDSNYVYVSVATNAWKRAALSTW